MEPRVLGINSGNLWQMTHYRRSICGLSDIAEAGNTNPDPYCILLFHVVMSMSRIYFCSQIKVWAYFLCNKIYDND
jgi:hypothetical protein